MTHADGQAMVRAVDRGRYALVRMTRARRWWSWLTTYDIFPELSGRVRRFVYTPLGVLTVAAAVALLCGLALHPRVFALCGGLLAVIAIGIVWPWLTLRGINGVIGFARERVVEGERTDAWIEIVNHWPWPAVGVVLKGDKEHNAKAVSQLFEVRLWGVTGRHVTKHRWEFIPVRRGVYPRNDAVLTCGFPFGVWEAKRSLRVARQLLVWPRTYPVGPAPLLDDEVIVEGHVARNKVGNSGDILGVRPYRQGDSPRRIHWPQSARYDRLIVCELQTTSRQVVQIVLDIDPAIHVGGDSSEGSREWAIRIAASMAKGWLEAGIPVGLVTHGVLLAPRGGRAQLIRVLDALARLPDDNGIPLADLLAHPACQQVTSLQIIITTDRAGIATRQGRANHRRWVVLKCAGFMPGEVNPLTNARATRFPFTPWLVIDSAAHIPYLLRFGWSEARHGS
jgi:uncharacterized protein (DUF58 family)